MGASASICPICGAKFEVAALFCPRDGAPLGSAAPSAGDPYAGVILPGPVRVERLIGVGSMGRVYRGRQDGTDRPVAIKILHPELSANPELVARFRREAQIAGALAHPHIVQILTAGELDVPPPAPLFIVMELLDGISLRSALAAAGGSLPLLRALGIALQLCEAVGEAHAQGVVHRDLKPENVMLVRQGDRADFVKILDFGIARLPGANTPAVTQAGRIFGTARYISPEGASGLPVRPAADVYALATMLYQALAGATPFDGEATVDLLAQQISAPPPFLGSLERGRDVPAPLVSVIMRNLAKSPQERSPDARALGRALLEAARASALPVDEQLSSFPFTAAPGRPAQASALATRPLGTPLLTAAGPLPAPGFAPAAAPSPAAVLGHAGHRRTLVVVVGCLLGGAGLAALGAARWESDPQASSPPSGSSHSSPQAVPSLLPRPHAPATAPHDGLDAAIRESR